LEGELWRQGNEERGEFVWTLNISIVLTVLVIQHFRWPVVDQMNVCGVVGYKEWCCRVIVIGDRWQ